MTPLYPVYYLESLSTRIISPGTLWLQGMRSESNLKRTNIYHSNGKIFMHASRITTFKVMEDALHHVHTRIVHHYTANQVLSYCASKLSVYDLWHH